MDFKCNEIGLFNTTKFYIWKFSSWCECSVYTSLISVKVLRSVDKLIEVCVFTYMYLGTLASEFKAKQTIELNVNT